MKVIKKNICYVIIILVGLVDIIYGLYTWYQKEDFINQAKTTTGTIYSISNNKKDRLLYINYYIQGEKYEGMIVTTNKAIQISDSIKIYYDKDNPNKISNGEIKHVEYLMIVLGIIFVFLGLLLTIYHRKKEIEKKE